MEINRRGLFIGILSGIVAGQGLILPPAYASVPEFSKYATTVRLQKELIERNEELKVLKAAITQQYTENQHLVFKEHPLYGQFQNETETLINHLMDAYPAPATFDPALAMEIKKLFTDRSSQFDTLSVQQLQRVVEGTIPVMVLKNMLCVYRMPFNSCMIPSFDRFSVQYRPYIFPYSTGDE